MRNIVVHASRMGVVGSNTVIHLGNLQHIRTGATDAPASVVQRPVDPFYRSGPTGTDIRIRPNFRMMDGGRFSLVRAYRREAGSATRCGKADDRQEWGYVNSIPGDLLWMFNATRSRPLLAKSRFVSIWKR